MTEFWLKLSMISGMVLAVSACATSLVSNPDMSSPKLSDGWEPIPGISGIAAMSDDVFLVVHDAKAHKTKSPRLGIVSIDRNEQAISYSEVKFPAGASSLSSDLEGACAVPGRPGELIVNESGTWQGDFGRMFHIRLSGDKADLVSEHKLPFTRDNNPDQSDGDQYEGLACAPLTSGNILILLGERGGTTRTPDGILRWGTYNMAANTMEWNSREMTIAAPDRFGVSGLRSITGLSIDDKNTLWASASVDSDTDLGPFRSVVYPIGQMTPGAPRPVQKLSDDRIWVIEALKVEGVETRGGMSIGSEDENFGGVWRQLPSTPTQ